jgi:RimJ/RimL family protein N-acetyltransferase
VIDPRDVRTQRLHLTPMGPADADDLFPILSDEAGWWYEPASRHTDPLTTLRYTERAAARWPTDGLSYWTARRHDTGEVVGLGGVQRHRTRTWNLSYRIAIAHQRQGLATELALASIEAAGVVDPDTVVIAWIAEHNEASRLIAQRIGLVNRGLFTDHSDGKLRLAYSDRPFEPEALTPVPT